MHLFCIEAEKHYGMGAIISIIDIEKKNCPPPIQRAVHNLQSVKQEQQQAC